MRLTRADIHQALLSTDDLTLVQDGLVNYLICYWTLILSQEVLAMAVSILTTILWNNSLEQLIEIY